MSYKLEVHPGESIIWETWNADFDPEADTPAITREQLKMLNAARGPMVVITDTRAVTLTFDDILYLASNAVPEELNHHPRLSRIILVTTSEIVAKSAEGLDNEVFGYVKLDIVASREEALACARQYLP